MDVSSGAAGLVIRWEGRPWVVILTRPTQPMSARLSARWPVDATLIAGRPSPRSSVAVSPPSALIWWWSWPGDAQELKQLLAGLWRWQPRP
jgi:hypothetical protein